MSPDRQPRISGWLFVAMAILAGTAVLVPGVVVPCAAAGLCIVLSARLD